MSKRKNEDMNVRNTATKEYGKKVTVRVQKVKKSHINKSWYFYRSGCLSGNTCSFFRSPLSL